MNNPTGTQLPERLLPAIDELRFGDVVALFVSNGADKSTVESHWLYLQARLKGFVEFVDMRGKVEGVAEFRRFLHNLRKSRQKGGGRTTVLIYSFPQRFTELEMEVDMSFYYLPGIGQVNLQLGKLRGVEPTGRSKVLELPHVSNVRAVEEVEPRLQVMILGDRPQDGKSTLAHDLREFLQARYPHAKLEHYSSEGNFGEWADGTAGKRRVSAPVIQILDTNDRPVSQGRLNNLPFERFPDTTFAIQTRGSLRIEADSVSIASDSSKDR